jgi:ribosomal protein L11 methylase PrmA
LPRRCRALSPGGTLIVSGILATEEATVRHALTVDTVWLAGRLGLPELK